MANRGITLFEKLHMTRHTNFVGTLELRVLQIAKYWFDYSGNAGDVGMTTQQLAQLKSTAAAIHQRGFVDDNVNFARTWVSLYEGAVPIPETNGVEDWDLTTSEGLDNLTKWLVQNDQLSSGVEATMKIYAFR